MLSKWSFFSNDHASAYMGLIQGYSIKKRARYISSSSIMYKDIAEAKISYNEAAN